MKADSRSLLHSGPVTIGLNRNTVGLCAVLLAMLYAGAGQSNGSAYLLCFIVSSLAAISMLHAWANLRGLAVEARPIRPVFAGDTFHLPLHITAKPGRRHSAVSVCAKDTEQVFIAGDISTESPGEAVVQVPAPRRGCFDHVDLTVTSLFPLGFFTALRAFTVRQVYHVYPKPAGDLPLPIVVDPTRQTFTGARVEGEDFVGVREWRPGESMRHVDWKAAARGHRLLVKQWRGIAGDLHLILDWDQIPNADPEHRLSQLARWVLMAEHSGVDYGLRLPDQTIKPSHGDVHMHTCLKALAAFDGESAAVIRGAKEEPV